jgi:collagenase-like PrtC family protease
MTLFEDGINEVLVNNDLMEQYIRTNYPKYPIISSTTKRITTLEKLQEELEKDYKLVVLDYDFNNQWDVLASISHPEKCEILINPVCNPRCPLRTEHYKEIGLKQKGVEMEGNPQVDNCQAQYRKMNEVQKLPTFISREDLWNKYVPMGFKHFKIEGRATCPLKPIEWYLYYMVKPEYYDEERGWLHMAFETIITEPNLPITPQI